MKFIKALSIGLFIIAFTTAVFADKVKVDYDHSTNFMQIKTYSWSTIHTANTLWDERVKSAVDKELVSKGWAQVPTGGDVALVAVEKTSVQQQYDTFYQGFGGRRRFGGFGDTTTTVDNYEVGTLMVSILDGNSKQLIWRGTSSGDLSDSPEKNTKKLDKGVDKMFKKFPPNSAK